MRPAIAALGFVLLAVPAAAQQAGVAVTEAWSRASTPGAKTGAIYVTVTTGAPDRLVSASTPAAATAEVHQSLTEGGVSEMRPVPGGLPVAPGSPIHMAPGGYHIMLMGLQHPLTEGSRVPVTLIFEHAGAVAVEAAVAGPGASAPPAKP